MSQLRNVADACTAMKQFAAGTSQETAKGSFAPLSSLTALSDAIVCLCDEMTQMRAELDDLRTKARTSAPGGLKKKAKVPVRNTR